MFDENLSTYRTIMSFGDDTSSRLSVTARPSDLSIGVASESVSNPYESTGNVD